MEQQQGRHDTVFDAGAEHIGKVYAEALLGAAGRAGVADLVVDQLNQLASEVLTAHPRLAQAFGSPRVSAEEKSRILDRLFADQFDPVLIRFLKVVAARSRLGYVRSIAEAARARQNEMLGRKVAEITTAVPLDEATRTEVMQRLEGLLNSHVILREKVNPSIVGGMVVRVGDTVYDASVAGQLNNMAKRTRQAFAKQLMGQSDRFATST